MLFFVIALYFFLACLVSWLVLFPTGREMLWSGVTALTARFANGWQRWQQRQAQRVSLSSAAAGARFNQSQQLLRQHYPMLLAGFAVLSLPPLLAWWLSGRTMLDGFSDAPREQNLQIAELLKGEQLAPPAALPPLAFTTLEVQQFRPMLANASRNWQLLNPDFTQRLLLIFKIMKERHGYEMAILEGYRSPERQNLLASMGPSVTNAAAFQSYHQFGLAADCAFLREGKLVISEKDPWAMRGYQLYGEVAESVGLTWGGRWKLMDFGHAELRMAGVIKRGNH